MKLLLFGLFAFAGATLFKTKEIAKLEMDMTSLGNRVDICESGIFRVEGTLHETKSCSGLKVHIEELLERFNTLEFKVNTLIGPKSPSSLNRRPAISRRGTSNYSNRDANSLQVDYFSPSPSAPY